MINTAIVDRVKGISGSNMEHLLDKNESINFLQINSKKEKCLLILYCPLNIIYYTIVTGDSWLTNHYTWQVTAARTGLSTRYNQVYMGGQ